jgi:Fur family peroxide stress response transcriptional regulator
MNKAQARQVLAAMKDAATKAGIRLTHQRLLIFGAVAASESHPTADDIHRKLVKRIPSLSLDTVYRTLWMLEGLGMLKSVGMPQESVRFDANLGRHHHFRCERCGMIRDFVSSDLDALNIPAGVEQFGCGTSLQVEVRGICKACQQKEGTEKKIVNLPTKSTNKE